MIVSFLTSTTGGCGHQLRSLRDIDVDHPGPEGRFRSGERTLYCPECDGDLGAYSRQELVDWLNSQRTDA